MNVCTHNGLEIVVLTRNEHCPPHVHVGTDKWEARFKFSFWHNGVCLWDVTPEKNQPSVSLLEELRQVLRDPANLRKARQCWWGSRQTVCLDSLCWDLDADEVVRPKAKRPKARKIQSARFDGQAYGTVLQLAGEEGPLEIKL